MNNQTPLLRFREYYSIRWDLELGRGLNQNRMPRPIIFGEIEGIQEGHWLQGEKESTLFKIEEFAYLSRNL